MSRPLKVALLQLRAFDLAEHPAAWEELLRRIDEAAALEPDLIVLPEASYPAYFLHSLDTYERAGVRPDAEIEGTLSERARRHGCYIAAGLVLRGAGEPPDGAPLENVCVLFAPDGAELGRYRKHFLWHFDHRWFARGDSFPVFHVAGEPAGLLICADGRLPEVARSLAVGGAKLLIDSTAWMARGRDAATLSSPHVEYLMRARAIENGVWVVAADKVGTEAGSLVYAGLSGVIDPHGEWVAQGPSDRPGIVTCTLDLEAASGPPVPRRSELYKAAAMPGERSTAAALAREALIAEDAAARVAAVALHPSPSAVELMERARTILRALEKQQTALVVLPDLAGGDTRAVTDREFLPLFTELAAQTDTLLTVQLAERDGGQTFKTVYLLRGGALLASHRQTHLSEPERAAGFTAGDEPPPVMETAVGYIGLLGGSEGLAPELGRSLKLRGAELIAWSAGEIGAPLRVMARTRAHENRTYVAAAGSADDDGGAYIVDPSGGVLGETLAGEQMATSADINRAFARWNDMAPQTNPLRNRDPAAYAALFRESNSADAGPTG